MPQFLARFAKTEGGIADFLLQNVEAFCHLAQLVMRVRPDRHYIDRAWAASRSPRPRAAIASEKSLSVPEVSRFAALVTSVAE